jgi:hypothetical protein
MISFFASITRGEGTIATRFKASKTSLGAGENLRRACGGCNGKEDEQCTKQTQDAQEP